ncbi:MAG: hypothetical protein RLZ14_379 [Actinomycetota bacterium]
MQPHIRLDRTIVNLHHDNTVHVMLDIQAPPAPPAERAPVDVVVVLDRSGSMAGAPLDAVKRATAEVIGQIGPDDRVGVVAFDDTVDLVLPLGRHSAGEAAAAVRSIRSGGSTNLSGGWLKALEMLVADARPEAVRRIVILTDGHANCGIIDRDGLAGMVRGGQREGVTTSCIGFADGYDERLLAALADAGMGNDYWCDGPDQARAVFGREFGGLAAVVAQNLSVEVRPTSAVAVAAVLNEFPVTDVPGGAQVALGDAIGDERRRVVARFNLRPIPDEGEVEVATFVIRWVATVGDIELHTITVPVRITAGQVGEVDAGADPEVHEEVRRLEVARNRQAARDAAESGRYDDAADILRSSLAYIDSDDVQAEELRIDVARLSSRMWSAADSKRHYSRARGVHKGRKADFTAAPNDGEPGTASGPDSSDSDGFPSA